MSTLQSFVAAENDRARAAMLLTEPLFDLMTHWVGWHVEAKRAGFAAGVAYLDALVSTLAKPRHRGNLVGLSLVRAETDLLIILDRDAA